MNQSTPGPTVGDILDQVAAELAKAMQKHAPMPSCHHGHSVILEELEELFDEIKANRGNLGPAKREAIQIAAVAVRYVLDLCQPDPAPPSHCDSCDPSFNPCWHDVSQCRKRPIVRPRAKDPVLEQLSAEHFDAPAVPALCSKCGKRPADPGFAGLCEPCSPF